ncbi:hypothetical protein [Streptomyces sp. CBMA123]|uniref:hypothetical protein n=1 Tax=Streptomyces sp. CBMA123 TaxID=1896313 RepID=UPI001661C19C|nr:hypothetical protein [Streptomyces sp. CBMA123]MBD0693422.1 hypothetical protein [Streptomyces sp. CBMA123]
MNARYNILRAQALGPEESLALTEKILGERCRFRAGPGRSFGRRAKRAIGAGILPVAALLFVLWGHPTALPVFWFAVVVLIAFGIREFLAPGPGLAGLRREAPLGPGDPRSAAG